VRLTITSADGIGDFLLRLPWFFAMTRAGWKLQILLRKPSYELAVLAALRAECVIVDTNPYSKESRLKRHPFRHAFSRIRAFDPEILFFGPSNPSFLEEEAITQFPAVRKGGFRLPEGFWPSEGLTDPHVLAGGYDFHIPVAPDEPDHLRNSHAASYLLGTGETLPPFRFGKTFPVPPVDADAPIAVCPGYREGDYFAGWGNDAWSRELVALEKATGARFIFFGNSGEQAANDAIFRSLAIPERHENRTGHHRKISDLCADLASCRACIAKDSGILHLAAALGLPVLGVFGGGHWGRFFPQADRGVVISSRVPCRGCNWRCHLPVPACVRGLPDDSLLKGWQALSTLETGKTTILEFDPSDDIAPLIRPPGQHAARCHEERRKALSEQRAKALHFPGWLISKFR
jgi:hypothetical protein